MRRERLRDRYVSDATADPRAASPSQLGGKGFNLVRLRSLGLAVPRFVIVTRRAFDEAVGRRLGPGLAALRDAADPDLAELAARLAARVRAVGCPAWLEGELRAALEAAGLRGPRLAVRSSVVGEDSEEHSFAGLMESRLNVPFEELSAALVEVWASAFGARALAYRRRKGLGSEPITTAVIVQEMLTPAASGVLFTRDPDPAPAGKEPGRRAVVSAAFGLGEGVVADAADADTFRIAWDGGGIERQLSAKRSRCVGAPAGGTVREELPTELRDAPVLGDARLRELCDLGVRLEHALGSPQDVEWALDEAGKLFVLQARPIVSAPTATGAGCRIWDNSNIVESYPGLTLPLTFSFVREAYERAFRRAAAAYYPFANPTESRPELFTSLLGLLRGRVYYNLLNWYEMFAYVSSPERHRERWDRMVGVSDRHGSPRAARSPVAMRILARLGALRLLLGVRRHERRFEARFQAFHARHRDAALEPDAASIAVRFRRIQREAGAFWHLTLLADLCAMRYYDWVAALAARWAPDVPDLAHRLLCGEPGVESVAPARHLAALAERIRAEPGWTGLLRSHDDGEVWRLLGERPRLAPLRDALRAYLEAWGDRGIEELKLETPTFREHPERLVGLLRRYVEAGLRAGMLRDHETDARREAEREAGERIRGWRRPVFRWVLARARLAIRSRENMRFARSRLFGIVRRLFRRLGELLAAAGALERSEDVFYLTTDEALGFADATTPTADLRGLVALRRREYAGFAGGDLPDRFETAGFPALATPDRVPGASGGARQLDGIGCAAGIATGAAKVVSDPARAAVGRGDVLVARSTDPGWIFLMMSAAGLVSERGSPLSHTAIIGRELGIPTVVGVAGATDRIPDGARLRVDGSSGRVEWA